MRFLLDSDDTHFLCILLGGHKTTINKTFHTIRLAIASRYPYIPTPNSTVIGGRIIVCVYYNFFY